MKKLAKLLAAMSLATGLVFGGAAIAAATGPPEGVGPSGGVPSVTVSPPGNSGDNPGSPGDDCSHGASDQDCRPDPSENGQDCLDHGNAAGNEDHCLDTTTTTVTTTTEPPVTTTEPPVTTTEPPVVSTTTTTTPTRTIPAPKGSGGGGGNGGGGNAPAGKPGKPLAFTGVEDVVPMAGAALAFLTTGTGLMWAGSRRRRNTA